MRYGTIAVLIFAHTGAHGICCLRFFITQCSPFWKRIERYLRVRFNILEGKKSEVLLSLPQPSYPFYVLISSVISYFFFVLAY